MRLTFELGWIPPAELRGNSRTHHMAKNRKTKIVRQSGYDHVMADPFARSLTDLEYGSRPDWTIQFAFRNWRKIDLDNLAIGMKPWVDGLVDAGLLVDDDPDHLTYGAPTFERCKKGDEGVTVTLSEVLT